MLLEVEYYSSTETKYSFFYHFNKPQSKRSGKPQISLHYRGMCHLVDNIVVYCKTYGKINKRQPRFVMCGKSNKVKIMNGVAYVY